MLVIKYCHLGLHNKTIDTWNMTTITGVQILF